MIALPQWWCIAMIVLNGRHEDIERSLHFLEPYLLRNKYHLNNVYKCIDIYGIPFRIQTKQMQSLTGLTVSPYISSM